MRCLVLTVLVAACGSPAQTADAPHGLSTITFANPGERALFR